MEEDSLEDGIKEISFGDCFCPIWSLRHVPSIMNSTGSKARKLKEYGLVAFLNIGTSYWVYRGCVMIKDYYDKF